MPDYTIDIGYVHVGGYRMPDGSWVCAHNCPHPSHEPDVVKNNDGPADG